MFRCRRCKNRTGILLFLALHVSLFTTARGSDVGVPVAGDVAGGVAATWLVEPEELALPEGGSGVLSCALHVQNARAAARARAGEHVHYSWRHTPMHAHTPPSPDHTILPDANRSVLANGSLRIERMSRALAGQYACVARHPALGTLLATPVALYLAEVPALVGEARAVSAVGGGGLVVPCLAAPSTPRPLYRAAAGTRAPPPPARRTNPAPRPRATLATVMLDVRWQREGGVLAWEGARMSLTSEGALVIDPLLPGDSGRYACNVSLHEDPTQHAPASAHYAHRVSAETTVRVLSETEETPPTLTLVPQSRTVIEGSSVSLECSASGSPRPSIVWLHNEEPIDLSLLDSRVRQEGGGGVCVRDVTIADAGAYTCRAHGPTSPHSPQRVAAHTATLTVWSVPRVRASGGSGSGAGPGAGGSSAVASREGGVVSLACEVSGSPVPATHWLKDGELLRPNLHDITPVHPNGLRISGVMRSDAGVFQCVAVSSAGVATDHLTLAVLPPIDEEQVLAKAHKAKKNKKLNPKTFLSSLVSVEGAQLAPSHEGGIAPGAANFDGGDALGAALPAFQPDPLDFDYYDGVEALVDGGGALRNTSVGASAHSPRALRATTVRARTVALAWDAPAPPAAPPAYVLLYRASKSNRTAVVVVGEGRETRVRGLQPDTAYQFAVLALAGDKTVSPPTQWLEVRTEREEYAWGPPRDVTVGSAPDGGLIVRWGPPNPAPPSQHPYLIYYAPVRDNETLEMVSSRLAEAMGEGAGQSEEVVSVQQAGGGARQATLPLRGGAGSWAVRVAAVGGAPSSPVLARLSARPPARIFPAHLDTPPTNVSAAPTHHQSVVVRWAGVEGAAGYRVRYRVGGAGATGGGAAGGGARKRAESVAAPAAATSAEISHLLPDTPYQMRVCVVGGACSDWVSVTTAPRAGQSEALSVPAQPPPLNTRAGRDWISVRWAGPVDGAAPDEGAVTSYTLGWGRGVPDEHTVTLPPNRPRHTIHHLQSGTEYVISVRGNNAMGAGVPVYATVTTRAPSAAGDELDELDEMDEMDELDELDEYDEDEYEDEDEEPLIPPIGLKAIMLGSSTAVLYWTDSTLPKGQESSEGRRYLVRWQPADGGASGATGAGIRPRYFNATELNCMIGDLRPYTTYEFAVRLVHKGRQSAWSMVAANRTLEAPPSPPRDLTLSVDTASGANPALVASWAPPARPNGVITGYVVVYSVGIGDGGGEGESGEEWQMVTVGVSSGEAAGVGVARLGGVVGGARCVAKVQARNGAGLSPFTPLRYYTVPAEVGVSGGGGASWGGATGGGGAGAWLWASAGGACAVLALAAALALSLCCRRQHAPLSPDRSTYQKSGVSAALKPPDLWIHHDQMELKHIDKSHHSSMSGGSVCGEGALVSSSMTLGRAGGGGGATPGGEYPLGPAPPPALTPAPAPLYHPTYVAGGSGGSWASEDTAVLPSLSHSPAPAPAPALSYLPSYELKPMSGGGGGGGGGACYPRSVHAHSLPHHHAHALSHAHAHGHSHAHHPHLPHHDQAMCGSVHSSLASLPTQNLHCGGSVCGGVAVGAVGGTQASSAGSASGTDIYAVASRERERGHYVAYEPLGHYTHRDSSASGGSGRGVTPGPGPPAPGAGSQLHSFTSPALGAPGAGAAAGASGAGLLPRERTPSEHSTPTHMCSRVESPYRKASTSSPSPAHTVNRLHLGGGSVCGGSEELEPLTPSRSTERLNREMANLEGLMKDLSAITQHQFHC